MVVVVRVREEDLVEDDLVIASLAEGSEDR